MDRPRATLTGGGELPWTPYALFSSTDLLTQLAVERMLAGVATRRHGDVAEPIGSELEAVARGDSRSAISRRFKAATTKALDELLARDLDELDVAALMIEARRSFRRIKGCNDMATLTAAVRAEVALRVAADAGEPVTAPEYKHAAAWIEMGPSPSSHNDRAILGR